VLQVGHATWRHDYGHSVTRLQGHLPVLPQLPCKPQHTHTHSRTTQQAQQAVDINCEEDITVMAEVQHHSSITRLQGHLPVLLQLPCKQQYALGPLSRLHNCNKHEGWNQMNKGKNVHFGCKPPAAILSLDRYCVYDCALHAANSKPYLLS
jgi:hypothetical protein